MNKFSVTYEYITEESAENGEAEETGFLGEAETLHDAVALLYGSRTNAIDGGGHIEDGGSWLTCYGGREFMTGNYENRSLHPPRNITPSSYKRLGRAIRNWL